MGKFNTMEPRSSKNLEFRLARVRLGLHLYQVARQVGISPARLSQYEGGHRKPSPDLEAKLRALLGLPPKRGDGDEKT